MQSDSFLPQFLSAQTTSNFPRTPCGGVCLSVSFGLGTGRGKTGPHLTLQVALRQDPARPLTEVLSLASLRAQHAEHLRRSRRAWGAEGLLPGPLQKCVHPGSCDKPVTILAPGNQGRPAREAQCAAGPGIAAAPSSRHQICRGCSARRPCLTLQPRGRPHARLSCPPRLLELAHRRPCLTLQPRGRQHARLSCPPRLPELAQSRFR